METEQVCVKSEEKPGYAEGYEEAIRIVRERLDECICTAMYPSGEDWRYIPFNCYEEVMDELINKL